MKAQGWAFGLFPTGLPQSPFLSQHNLLTQDPPKPDPYLTLINVQEAQKHVVSDGEDKEPSNFSQTTQLSRAGSKWNQKDHWTQNHT